MEIVPIKTVKQYVNDFTNAIINDGLDKKLAHDQLLDAFSKEIFGQITFRYRDPAILSKPYEHVDEATRIGVRNIIKNADRKWKRLCMEFSKYKPLFTLIMPDELMQYLKDVVLVQQQDQKDPNEIPVDMGIPEEDIKELIAEGTIE